MSNMRPEDPAETERLERLKAPTPPAVAAVGGSEPAGETIGQDEAHTRLGYDAWEAPKARFRQAILDQAPTWEMVFDSGLRGEVVGVPDAAVVAARVAAEMEAEVHRLLRDQLGRVQLHGYGYTYRDPSTGELHQLRPQDVTVILPRDEPRAGSGGHAPPSKPSTTQDDDEWETTG